VARKTHTIDLETTSKKWFEADILGMGVYKDDTAYWTDNIASKYIPKNWHQVYHGGKYDLKVFARHKVRGARLDDDTMIMASLLPFEERGLEYLSMEVLGEEPWKIKWGKETPSIEKVKEHCFRDVENTERLYEELRARLEHEGLLDYYYKYAMPFNRLLTKIEYDGIRIDKEKAAGMAQDLDDSIKDTEEMLRRDYAEAIEGTEIATYTAYLGKWKRPETQEAKKKLFQGVNFNSPIQMLALLHDIGLDPRNIDGKPTTDTRALTELVGQHPFIKDFLGYRKRVKLLQFLEAWPKFMVGERLYFCLNQHVTATGRLSGSDPNLQQVPRRDKEWGDKFRSLFLPDEGEILSVCDYGQIEMRIAAHYSQDPVLIKAVKEGIDYYGLIATRVLGLDCHPNSVKELHSDVRDVAKVIGLGHALYGMGVTKLAQTIGCTESEASDYAASFREELPVLSQYKYSLAAKAKAQGSLTGLFGRKLWFDEETPMHVPFNHLVQNAASDLNCFTQLQITKALKGIANLKLLVHDEVLYSHRRGDKDVVANCLRKHMVDQFKTKLSVPLDIDISTGENWSCKS